MKTKPKEQPAREDESPDDLPEGWAPVTLGDVVESMKNGLYKPADAYSSEGVACLRMYNIESGRIVWKDVKRMMLSRDEKKEYGLLPGDLLVNRVNSHELVGKTAVIPFGLEPCVFESKNIRVRVIIEAARPDYVNYALLLSGQQHFGYNSQQVVGMASISQPQVAAFPLPLPPAREQIRILCKIDELLRNVNASRERLAKVPKILKAFRQSVLAAACSEGEHVALEEVLVDLKYGTAMKCTPRPVGTPVLRIPNIGDGSIRLDDLKYAKLPPKEHAAFRLEPGDVLLIRSNGSVSLVGKSALVATEAAGFAYAGYLIRLRVDRKRILPAYLNLALQTQDLREQIEMPARSTSGVHNINSGEVRRLRINLPSLEDQTAAVRRVQILFKLADKIEKRVEAATKRADKLTQAILAKAFRGELVPTEAELARKEGRDYEPASVLLERIKAERAKAALMPNNNRGPRRRSAKAGKN